MLLLLLLLSHLGLPALKHRRLHIRIYCEIIALVQETLVLLLPHAFILVRDLGVSVQGQHILLLRLEQALVAGVELQVGLVLRLHLRLHGLLVELGVEGDLPVLPLRAFAVVSRILYLEVVEVPVRGHVD